MALVVYANYCEVKENIAVVNEMHECLESIMIDRDFNNSLCDYYIEEWKENKKTTYLQI